MGNYHCIKSQHRSREMNLEEQNPGATQLRLDPLINADTYKKSPSILTQPRGRIVVALCNYTPVDENDITFKKGDRLEVVNDSDSDWLTISHLISKEQGSIPLAYVAQELSVENEDWFFENISRKEASNLLLSPENLRGTFLVRNSQQDPNGYALSVKYSNGESDNNVKHYKIQPLDNGGVYIWEHQKFFDLRELVRAYSEDKYDLCEVLSNSCPKPQPQMWDLSPKYKDEWEVPREKIKLIKQLGKGNFGEVYYGKWNDETDVAVKTLRAGTMSKEDFLREASIMKQVKHKYLVALYAVCTTEEPMYIVQEYVSKGSLLDFLRKDEGKMLEFGDLLYIAFQVASGMEYLESKQLIHRDLAARNVLIGERNTVKICDFGLARVIAENIYFSTFSKFPVKWTSPEGLLRGQFSIKSDVWSYGIFLMELFTYGKTPYKGMSTSKVKERVPEGYRMPKPITPCIPDGIYEIMLNTWEEKPENRPTFKTLAHDFYLLSSDYSDYSDYSDT